jgi:hypothetical protein
MPILASAQSPVGRHAAERVAELFRASGRLSGILRPRTAETMALVVAEAERLAVDPRDEWNGPSADRLRKVQFAVRTKMIDPRGELLDPAFVGALLRILHPGNAPSTETLSPTLGRLVGAMDRRRENPILRVLDAGAAFLVLSRSEPFGEGGRLIARLLAGALLAREGLNDAGLWSPSAALLRGTRPPSSSDNPSRAEIDDRILAFVEACLEEVRRTERLLERPDLTKSVAVLVERLPDPRECADVLMAVIDADELSRAETIAAADLPGERGKGVLDALLAEGLLLSDVQGKLRLGLPLREARRAFPKLFL